MKNDFSFLIIENTNNIKNDTAILEKLYDYQYEFIEESTLEHCKLPEEDQISIGYYKNQIILCDRMELVNVILENSFDLTFEEEEEQRLVDVFPLSEILTLGYIKEYGFYGYSLIQKGIKKRIKLIVHQSNYVDIGKPLPEERYNSRLIESDNVASVKKEEHLVKSTIFTLLKNKLGIDLNETEPFEFMNEVTFRTYEIMASEDSFIDTVEEKSQPKLITYNKSNNWIIYVLVLSVILSFILFVLMFNK